MAEDSEVAREVETAVAFDRVPPPPVPADPNAGRREPDGTFLHTALDDGW